MLQVFVEMFQACVDAVLRSTRIGPEHVPEIVKVAICICKTRLESPHENVEAKIVYKYADHHRKGRNSGVDEHRNQLIRSNHLFDPTR